MAVTCGDTSAATLKPCVLAPGHQREDHQDEDGVRWGWRDGPAMAEAAHEYMVACAREARANPTPPLVYTLETLP